MEHHQTAVSLMRLRTQLRLLMDLLVQMAARNNQAGMSCPDPDCSSYCACLHSVACAQSGHAALYLWVLSRMPWKLPCCITRQLPALVMCMNSKLRMGSSQTPYHSCMDACAFQRASVQLLTKSA